MRRHILPRPALILVMGVAGAGKSTLCRAILRRIQAVYLDNNHIADAFFPDTRTGCAYHRSRPQLYRALYTITEENLKVGNSVLLDAPHVKQMQTGTWRTFVKDLALATNAELVIIRCICSETTLRKRIRRRGQKRDAWKLKHWKDFLRAEPLDLDISFPHLDIDTESPLAKTLPLAVGYIVSRAKRPLKSAVTLVRQKRSSE